MDRFRLSIVGMQTWYAGFGRLRIVISPDTSCIVYDTLDVETVTRVEVALRRRGIASVKCSGGRMAATSLFEPRGVNAISLTDGLQAVTAKTERLGRQVVGRCRLGAALGLRHGSFGPGPTR